MQCTQPLCACVNWPFLCRLIWIIGNRQWLIVSTLVTCKGNKIIHSLVQNSMQNAPLSHPIPCFSLYYTIIPLHLTFVILCILHLEISTNHDEKHHPCEEKNQSTTTPNFRWSNVSRMLRICSFIFCDWLVLKVVWICDGVMSSVGILIDRRLATFCLLVIWPLKQRTLSVLCRRWCWLLTLSISRSLQIGWLRLFKVIFIIL